MLAALKGVIGLHWAEEEKPIGKYKARNKIGEEPLYFSILIWLMFLTSTTKQEFMSRVNKLRSFFALLKSTGLQKITLYWISTQQQLDP